MQANETTNKESVPVARTVPTTTPIEVNSYPLYDIMNESDEEYYARHPATQSPPTLDSISTTFDSMATMANHPNWHRVACVSNRGFYNATQRSATFTPQNNSSLFSTVSKNIYSLFNSAVLSSTPQVNSEETQIVVYKNN